jgi:1,4-alpha-glucan branching enzyme
MRDDSSVSITREIAEAVHLWSAGRAYPVHLIAESNVYDEVLLDRSLGAGAYDLLWNDEIPHALFSATLGQHRIDSRTYRGFLDVGPVLDAGYVFERKYEGEEIVRNPAPIRVELGSMMQGLQTHDQVGNHPEGRRLHQTASPELQKAAAALIQLHPAVPMCFMGEEFGAPSPFCFFVDFGDPHLRQAVVEGRMRDYHQHDWDTFVSPVEESTFLRSKLADVDAGEPGMLSWYRALIALRKEWKAAGLLHSDRLQVRADAAAGCFVLAYGTEVEVWVNLGSAMTGLPTSGKICIHSEWERFGGALDENGAGRILPVCSAAVISRL